MLLFLYARSTSGEINRLLFQSTLIVMGLATFSFVFASFSYYCSSLAIPIAGVDPISHSRRGDRCWLLGCILMFFGPILVLFTVGLFLVGSVWLALWLVYLLFVARCFKSMQTVYKNAKVELRV